MRAVQRRHFNVYIDEAGDDGWHNPAGDGDGTSSEWLVLAGVPIFEEYDRERTRVIDELRGKLKRPPHKALHWRDLRRESQKRLVASTLAAWPFTPVCFAALWKPRLLDAPGLRIKGQLYNYAARLLIERLSWVAEASGRRLNLLFESRATTSYEDLQSYIESIQADPRCSITPGTIAEVRPVPSSMKGAQIADFYAGAAQEALEREYGISAPDYLLRVRHQLFRRPGRSVLDDGFKVFPDPRGLGAYLWLDTL